MKNWSLNKKIWTILGLLSVAFVVCTLFGLNRLGSVRDAMNEITGSVVRRDQLIADIKDSQRLITIATLRAIVTTDPKKLEAIDKAFAEREISMNKALEEYKGLASEKGKGILANYLSKFEPYLAQVRIAKDLGVANKNAEASAAYIKAEEAYLADMRKYIDELYVLTHTQLEEKSKQANETASQAIWMSSVVSFFSILVSLIIAFFVLRSLTTAIAAIVKNLSDSSLQVGSASAQIASASEQLSQSATEQAASLEETAAAIEEMNSMVIKNSDNAKLAVASSKTSEKKAFDGKTTAMKMSTSMDDINKSNNAIMNQVNLSNEAMVGIVKVIEQIDKKTKVINEIVNKTELLSFNASVEAARAGEHGKGFAVVAEEVGNLARMSGAAAEDIGTLLEESITKVNKIVNETKVSVERLINEGKEIISQGTDIAKECGEVFNDVVENVSNVSGMASEISSASEEQSRGVSEISKAMTQLDQMTQQNAATAEECAASSEELSAQAEALVSVVDELVRTVNGNDASAVHSESDHKNHNAQGMQKSSKRNSVTPKNVLRMKPNRPKTAKHDDTHLERVSGDPVRFDSDGFKDV